MIPQHIAPRLSALDMTIVRSVPPGGNWKNIPTSVPSARLEQIRESFAAGKGSRSTYYGRLRREMPSYTISTYFTRPGNGCHIHWAQDRVLTYREAARLQSFPDSFVFEGSNSSIATQIGNAVPPLLAYQVAKALGPAGSFVDLFSGAGGLSLGFTWAGWSPLVASDIEAGYLRTYARNVHQDVVPGDLRDPNVVRALLQRVEASRESGEGGPLWLVGGPPCQGFSTAGNRRSREDLRNQLFENYRDLIAAVKPDGFIFENVTGILNMEGGKFFTELLAELRTVMDNVQVWRLNAEDYGVPQRRHRVLIVGTRQGHAPASPLPITGSKAECGRPWIGVGDALSDLPALSQGLSGEKLRYRSAPATPYQRLMRGLITPANYVQWAAEADSDAAGADTAAA